LLELGFVARDRLGELGQDGNERARDADEAGELPYLGAVATEHQFASAVERLGDRVGPGRRVPVLVAADPGAEAKRRADARHAPPQLPRQLGGLFEQALL